MKQLWQEWRKMCTRKRCKKKEKIRKKEDRDESRLINRL